jgi:DNA-binding NtrC family response regulator
VAERERGTERGWQRGDELPNDTGDDRPVVLLVEDDDAFACLVRDTLERRRDPPRVHLARDLEGAIGALSGGPVDLVVLDRRLPDGDGLHAMRGLVARGVDTPFLLLTADASAASAVEAMRAGACDYVVKGPESLARIDALASALLPGPAMRRARGAGGLVGGGSAIAGVRTLLRRYARSRACVLVEGETGVGKELVARALHRESARAGGPFVPINCGALPEHLVESELFGHVRGAFTGAHRDHAGLVEHAERGTLFLDEVEDLPLVLQGKLLRLLQESEYRPVGATRARHADVRVVAASNAQLHEMVEQRRFRRDLFYRLNVLRIVVPPLRERLDDLADLLRHLATVVAGDAGRLPPGFVGPGPEQLAALRAHDWPGNVRELGNLVERAAVVATQSGWGAGWEVALAQLAASSHAALAGECGAIVRAPERTAREQAERDALLQLLARHRWRREAAARELGVSRVTLWRRMRRAGLTDDDAERGST